MRGLWMTLAASLAAEALVAAPLAPALAKSAKECADDYGASKAAIKASGQSKRDFLAACARSGAAAPSSVDAASGQDAGVKMK